MWEHEEAVEREEIGQKGAEPTVCAFGDEAGEEDFCRAEFEGAEKPSVTGEETLKPTVRRLTAAGGEHWTGEGGLRFAGRLLQDCWEDGGIVEMRRGGSKKGHKWLRKWGPGPVVLQ